MLLLCCILARACWLHACNAGCTSSDGIPDRRPGEAKAACALRRGVVQAAGPPRAASWIILFSLQAKAACCSGIRLGRH